MTGHSTNGASGPDIRVSMPDADLAQDTEWCDVHLQSGTRRVRFHDYDAIYEIPGLYEHLFYDLLRCTSPATLAGMLAGQMEQDGIDPATVRALDLGAGNGIMGEELRGIGVSAVVGVDIIEEARTAALRDRPGVYDAYLATDIRDLPDGEAEVIAAVEPTCLTCVAALGFGDIPPDAFAAAWNLVSDDAVVGFNIKEDFLDDDADRSGFSQLIDRAITEGALEVASSSRYRHRDAMNGDPLHYVAITGRKRAPLPLAAG
ncbi:MAG: methyltransferase [Thermoleophilia bacterium]|nr:methyltransferase [Thermoleophilia bacterium]